ncbi:hypothetical protein [Streptomyces pratensis]|uniref:hypothetical protein n=1 Tax=Streptomyces pratensis TaxID=1169025 RepID=UPI003628E02F
MPSTPGRPAGGECAGRLDGDEQADAVKPLVSARDRLAGAAALAVGRNQMEFVPGPRREDEAGDRAQARSVEEGADASRPSGRSCTRPAHPDRTHRPERAPHPTHP